MESKRRIRQRLVVPGEKLAVMEEFAPGPRTFVIDGQVLSATYGIAEYDHDKMMVWIKPLKNTVGRPANGDIVEGVIDNLQAGHAVVTIHRIAGRQSTHRFSALLPLRHGRRGERSIEVKRGDTIRAGVESTLNATVHLRMNGEDLGVIKTACGNCGGEVIYTRQKNMVKCTECGFREPRSLAKVARQLKGEE